MTEEIKTYSYHDETIDLDEKEMTGVKNNFYIYSKYNFYQRFNILELFKRQFGDNENQHPNILHMNLDSFNYIELYELFHKNDYFKDIHANKIVFFATMSEQFLTILNSLAYVTHNDFKGKTLVFILFIDILKDLFTPIDKFEYLDTLTYNLHKLMQPENDIKIKLKIVHNTEFMFYPLDYPLLLIKTVILNSFLHLYTSLIETSYKILTEYVNNSQEPPEFFKNIISIEFYVNGQSLDLVCKLSNDFTDWSVTKYKNNFIQFCETVNFTPTPTNLYLNVYSKLIYKESQTTEMLINKTREINTDVIKEMNIINESDDIYKLITMYLERNDQTKVRSRPNLDQTVLKDGEEKESIPETLNAEYINLARQYR